MSYLKVLLILTFISCFNQSFCQQERTIDVNGTAEITITPDKLYWSVDVRNENNSAQAVKREVDETTIKILRIIDLQGISEKDVETSGISLSKNYYNDNNKMKYSGNNLINVTLLKIDSYTKLLDQIIEIDNVFPRSPSLTSTKEIETREIARTESIKNAKKKAEEMASVLGLKLGKVMKIEEKPINSYYPNPFNSTDSIQDSGMRGITEFREGKISIAVSTRIIFELVDLKIPQSIRSIKYFPRPC